MIDSVMSAGAGDWDGAMAFKASWRDTEGCLSWGQTESRAINGAVYAGAGGRDGFMALGALWR